MSEVTTNDDVNNPDGWEPLTEFIIEEKIELSPEQTAKLVKFLEQWLNPHNYWDTES